MRPSGGIPGSGAGRPQLAGGPGQLPPLQAQEGPGGQQGEVNRPYPGHASARTRIGKVRTKERTDKLLELLQSEKARILSTTISREADRWFVSLTCEVERPNPEPREVQGPEDVVGIDVGLCRAVGWNADRGPEASGEGLAAFEAPFEAALAEAEEDGSRAGSGDRGGAKANNFLPQLREGRVALCIAASATFARTSCTRPPPSWRKPSRFWWWRT
jgi:hypothetical protein